jgi:hypothetical protein
MQRWRRATTRRRSASWCATPGARTGAGRGTSPRLPNTCWAATWRKTSGRSAWSAE